MQKSTSLLYLATFFSIAVALVSYRFLGAGFDGAFGNFTHHLLDRRTAFILHVTTAPIALAIGSVQLFPKLRNKNKTLHRWLGRIYGISILLAGLSGLIVAIGARGGIVVQSGFALLALLWLATTAIAVYYAVQRQIFLHRRWIIRSFALTFAAVTLRLWLPIFFLNGYEYIEAIRPIAWLCWVPNLIFAEWWLRRNNRPATKASMAKLNQ